MPTLYSAFSLSWDNSHPNSSTVYPYLAPRPRWSIESDSLTLHPPLGISTRITNTPQIRVWTVLIWDPSPRLLMTWSWHKSDLSFVRQLRIASSLYLYSSETVIYSKNRSVSKKLNASSLTLMKPWGSSRNPVQWQPYTQTTIEPLSWVSYSHHNGRQNPPTRSDSPTIF